MSSRGRCKVSFYGAPYLILLFFSLFPYSTISRLNYETLIRLFDDLVLGTSYELETARNIFIEVLPHARSDACVRFIKYLVLEEKVRIQYLTLILTIITN